MKTDSITTQVQDFLAALEKAQKEEDRQLDIEVLESLILDSQTNLYKDIRHGNPGEKYNKLTALYPTRKDAKSGRVIWKWLCDCGNVIESSLTSVRVSNRKSCGCQRLEKAVTALRERSRKEEGKSCRRTLYTRYRSEARKASRTFNLSESQFYSMIEKNCSYCGAPPSNTQQVPWNDDILVYTGIDRVDSSGGYTVDNVVPCCRVCNVAKNNMSEVDFLNWVCRVYNHTCALLGVHK